MKVAVFIWDIIKHKSVIFFSVSGVGSKRETDDRMNNSLPNENQQNEI